MHVCSLVIFLAASTAIHSAHVQDLEQNYAYHAILDDAGNYTLYWNFDLEQENITFAVRVQTTGWIGFGLSPNGQMPLSDVVIGWVDNTGQIFFHDRFADDRVTPTIDRQQDWVLLGAEEENGYTILELTRKFVTCDERDLDITSDTARIIWSYHSQDPPISDPSQPFSIHQQQGSLSLNILGGPRSFFQEPDTITSFNITSTNVTIPHDQDTTYWCTVYPLPNVSREQEIFIYRTSPIVMEGNEEYVHHFLVYLCPPDQPVHTGDCRDIGEHIEGCYGSKLIGAWAVGGESFDYPEGIALPLGGPDFPASHVLIEVHYDNQQLVSGIMDNSGMEFFYTTQEPTHRAGVLAIGSAVTPIMMIPPQLDQFVVNGFCSASCLDQYLPEEGAINILSNGFHTHLLGTGLVLQHYTQNEECSVTEELEPIDSNLRYDFNYQAVIHLPSTRLLQKGDSLGLKCIYRSTERDNVTFGGLGTYQEMCLTYVLYYPEIDLATCISLPQYESAYASFLSRYLPGSEADVANAIQDVLARNNTGIVSAFSSIDWSEEAVQNFIDGIEDSDIYQGCFANIPVSNSSVPSLYPDTKPNPSCSYEAPNQCTGYQPQSCCDRLRDVDPSASSTTPDADGAETLMVSMTTMTLLLLALLVLI